MCCSWRSLVTKVLGALFDNLAVGCAIGILAGQDGLCVWAGAFITANLPEIEDYVVSVSIGLEFI